MGLFKKIVIADNLGRHVDAFIATMLTWMASSWAWALCISRFRSIATFPATQILRSVAPACLFELTRNFINPYFSRDIAEFWRRWHITLSTWFRDYLYLPLGGNRNGRWRWLRNILLTFTISWFWHGGSWNFIAGASCTGCIMCR